MFLNINNIRQLNERDEEISYKIVEKCIEKFFNDLIRHYGLLKQKHINLDSSYLPHQYLSEGVLQRVVTLLEDKLGYAIIVQKMENKRVSGYKKGDLVQILLYDPLDFDESDVNMQANSLTCQAIYSTFHQLDNISGNAEIQNYLTCENFKDNFYLKFTEQPIELGSVSV